LAVEAQFKGEYFSSGDDAFEKLRELLLSKIDVLNDASLCEAANKLRNDEHIDAAIGADIIDFAYVIVMMANVHNTEKK